MNSKSILLSLCLCASVVPLHARDVSNAPGPLTGGIPADPTSLIPTNAPGPIAAALNILPAADLTLTNTYQAGDAEFNISPLWKTATAAGTTPYLSTSVRYSFTQNFGVEGEVVTLGDGQGTTSLDSEAIEFVAQKTLGNVAGYIMGGAAVADRRFQFGGDFGGGIKYRYKTKWQIFLDTRYRLMGRQSDESGWLTRAGCGLAF